MIVDGTHFAPIVEAPDEESAEWRARHLSEQLHRRATDRLIWTTRYLHSHSWHRLGMPNAELPEPLLER